MYLSQIILVYCVVLPFFSVKYIQRNLVHCPVRPKISKLATACTSSHTSDMYMHFHSVIFTLIRYTETEHSAHKVYHFPLQFFNFPAKTKAYRV